MSKILKATYGSPDHPLVIGDLEIPCYVLEDGRRVLAQGGMLHAIDISHGGSGGKGGDRLVKFVSGNIIKSFDNKELDARTANPIKFRTGSSIAYGYEATLLPDICDVVLEARKAGKLQKQQDHIAKRCEILVRGLARVGIIALVDEATGYQEIRDRRALQEILDRYLRKEFAAWAKKFPDEFFMEIFRLRGWQWRGMKVNRPSVVGKYITDIVYARLAPGIVEELEKRNPKDERGNRKGKHHQLLTDEVGHPALAQHLYAVIGFMRASTTWDQFYRMMQRAFPKKEETLPLLMEDL